MKMAEILDEYDLLRKLTITCIMLTNGQTYLKNFAV